MNLTNYTVSNERTRLSGQLWPRGVQSGGSTAGLLVGGSLFAGIGVFIALVGLKVINVNPKSVHAPYSVIFLAGSVFYAGGLWLWFLAYQQNKENRRKAEALAEHPGNVALADYDWNPKGFAPSRWKRAVGLTIAAVVFSMFFSVFNIMAFAGKVPLIFKILVGVFDVFAIIFWYYAIMEWLRAAKFGDSRVEYTQFPYVVGQPIKLRWLSPTGINRADSGTFTLRCVEQWYEIRGSGKNQSKQLIQEVIWSGTWNVPASDVPPGKWTELTFDSSADTPPTNLSAAKTKAVFWDLAVSFKERGVDFAQFYLVPVYGIASAAAPPPTSIAQPENQR